MIKYKLFKDTTIKEKLRFFEVPNIKEKINIINKWHEYQKSGELESKTETQTEQAFNNDLFINVLGYTPAPASDYTIEPKASTHTKGGKQPDLILGFFTKEKKRVHAVCEIKSVNVILDIKQSRKDTQTPVEQAFRYKQKYKDCNFCILTNFKEIRLYQSDELTCESFTLESLTSPKDDYYEFKKFYYLLCEKNFVSQDKQSNTLKLISEHVAHQKEITNKFYNDYKQLRNKLIKDIIKNNIIKKDNFNIAVEKAQKIIDRIVFICFCEDCGLLPEFTIESVLKYNNDLLNDSKWGIFKRLFQAVDCGSEKLQIPNGYNGELFKPDEILDKIKISDDICEDFKEISKYDFKNDLTVDILGHIFEKSISDIEDLKASASIEDKENKRKKDGIFYTPDYIVEHIINISIKQYLKEKFNKIHSKYRNDLKIHEEYKKELENIKILDSACGSGAFLVGACKFLFKEHKRVNNILNKLRCGGVKVFEHEDYTKHILQNNLYGVDLNNESVEITKLSLWINTAKKNQKLVSLKNNIKCGNSLIDDENKSEKAFKWYSEFKEIMQCGGFNCIIGNPPYIKESENKQAFNGLKGTKYYKGKMDIANYFTCHNIDLLKDNGYLTYIAPSSWITNDGAYIMRNKILQDTEIKNIVDFADYKVFKEAGIQTMIYSLQKTPPKKIYDVDYVKVVNKSIKENEVMQALNNNKFNEDDFISHTSTINAKLLMNNNIEFLNNQNEKILNKIMSVKDVFYLDKDEISEGIHATPQKAFLINKNDIHKLTSKEKEFIKLYFTHCKRYASGDTENYIFYIHKGNLKELDENLFCNFKKNLDKYKTQLENRRETKNKQNRFFHISFARNENLFKQCKKIISNATAKRPTFYYTDDKYYISTALDIIKTDRIDLKYLTCVLNSKLIMYWLKYKGKMQGNMFKMDTKPLLKIPVVNTQDKSVLIGKCDYMQELQKEFNKLVSGFLEIVNIFYGGKITTKAKEFYKLSFKDFAQATKPKTYIHKQNQEFLNDFFEDMKTKAINLKIKIDDLDDEIDEIVYNLYDLSDNDIKHIQKDLNL